MCSLTPHIVKQPYFTFWALVLVHKDTTFILTWPIVAKKLSFKPCARHDTCSFVSSVIDARGKGVNTTDH